MEFQSRPPVDVALMNFPPWVRCGGGEFPQRMGTTRLTPSRSKSGICVIKMPGEGFMKFQWQSTLQIAGAELFL